MKLSRHLIVALLMVVALTASAQLFFDKQLVPKNASTDEHFAFRVSSRKIGGTVHFSVTVIPKTPELLYCDARLMMFDGQHKIVQMSLDDGKPYQYQFGIASNYFAYSQFIFRYSTHKDFHKQEDADTVWFFLRDFAAAPNTALEPTPKGFASRRRSTPKAFGAAP